MKQFYCCIDRAGQDAGTITCSANNAEEALEIIEEMLLDDHDISFIGQVKELIDDETIEEEMIRCSNL